MGFVNCDALSLFGSQYGFPAQTATEIGEITPEADVACDSSVQKNDGELLAGSTVAEALPSVESFPRLLTPCDSSPMLDLLTPSYFEAADDRVRQWIW